MAHLSKHAKSSAGFIVCLFPGMRGAKGNERYAFKAQTDDGRSRTAFVRKANWTAAEI